VYVHPTSDLAVLNLAQIINELPQCVASVPCYAAAETLINKKAFYQSLQEAAIPHPITLFSDDEDIEAISHKLPFPVFIKPSLSQIFAQKFQVKGFVATNVSQLRKYLNMIAYHDIEVIVQEIIMGPNTNHYPIIGYLDQYGRPLIVVALQKLRQPSFFSVASALKTIPRKRIEPLIHLTIPYLQSLGYHGLFGAEWKHDAKDGGYKLLEINARSCWFNTLQSACGVNHILMAYHEALGYPICPQLEYESEITGLSLLRDVWAIKEKLLRGTLKYRDVWRSYLGKKDWLIYAPDDPMPLLQRLRRLAS
jgi:predicted ATP-grasp superfamily ATP-dependent carboligase